MASPIRGAGTPAPTPGASVSKALARDIAGAGVVANLEDPRLGENRDFVIAFARELIQKETTIGRVGSSTAAAGTTRPPVKQPAAPAVRP